MHNKDVIFDVENRKIGIIKASCDEFHDHTIKVPLHDNSSIPINQNLPNNTEISTILNKNNTEISAIQGLKNDSEISKDNQNKTQMIIIIPASIFNK